LRYLIILILLAACASSEKNTLSKTEKKAEVYYNQGTRGLVEKNYSAAIRNLVEAYKLKPEDSRIRNNLGMAFFFKKKPKLALGHLKKAVELDPKNTQAILNLATVYMEVGQYDLAEKNFKVVLDDLTFEQQFRTYYNLGVLSLKKNDNRQAQNFFRQAVSENEAYCPAHFQLGQIYYRGARYEDALSSFKNASKGVCYENPEPIYYSALTHIKLDQVASAKEKLEDIIGRFQGSPIAKSAQKQLRTLNRKLRQYEARVMQGEDPYGQILTPDF
tara:strand:+ start:3206 stop:4027 length:822 start_codon:yes stop_codon:yes gene_type:complete